VVESSVINKIESLEDIVRDNNCLNNDFFELCNSRKLTTNELKILTVNFYYITSVFANYSIKFCSNISTSVFERSTNGLIKGEEENFLAILLQIVMSEFDLGRGIKPSDFHYNAFLRLAPKLGLDSKKLKSHNYPASKSTTMLVRILKRNFSSAEIYPGTANFFVVEYSALEIINNLHKVYSEYLSNNHQQIYNDYDLEHLSVHQYLEVVHNDQVHDLLQMLDYSNDGYRKLKMLVEELSLAIRDFWNQFT
jgi:hypothetical protein